MTGTHRPGTSAVALGGLTAAAGVLGALAALAACGVLASGPARLPVTPPPAAAVPSGTYASGAAPLSAATGSGSGSGALAPSAPAGRGSARAVDRVEVDTCWTTATAHAGGQLLVHARSSDHAARLRAYRPDGTLIGEVANGGGQRYGGTVFAWVASDPVSVTVRSSSGGSVTVATTPYGGEDAS